MPAQPPPPRPAAGPVTLAVVNARVWTGAPRRPWADALVVRDGRLALVGGSAEARKLAAGSPGARVIDARGRLVLPGSGDAVEEALRGHAAGAGDGSAVTGSAVTSFAVTGLADAGLGTLETGRSADFVLVDHDLTRASPDAGDARVVLAVAGGRVVREPGHGAGGDPGGT